MQGCWQPLQRLLRTLAFDPTRDRLWFTGDLVNRGPQSLEVLRFVRALGDRAVTVLGNHDLHLLAVAGGGRAGARDTVQDILHAPDRDELLHWLRTRPLMHHDRKTDTLLVHAGLPPSWSTSRALALAEEAARALQGLSGDEFLLRHMYGDTPALWSETLTGFVRLRFIVNACTRLRYLRSDGSLELKAKGAPAAHPGLTPWFAAKKRRSAETGILFGHWSTLGRVHWPEHRIHALDSGCVWGGGLSALCIETGVVTAEPCDECRRPDKGSD